LRAALTWRNVGTESAMLLTAWNTLIFDDTFEFRQRFSEGITTLNPLTPPATAAIIFMVPDEVAKSDESIVLNFGDGSGGIAMSFIIRPGVTVDVSADEWFTHSTDRLSISVPESFSTTESWNGFEISGGGVTMNIGYFNRLDDYWEWLMFEMHTNQFGSAETRRDFSFDDGRQGVYVEHDDIIVITNGNVYLRVPLDGNRLSFSNAEAVILQIARSMVEMIYEPEAQPMQQINILQRLYQGLVDHAFSELIVHWDNGTQTQFFSDYDPDRGIIVWDMIGRAGNVQEVFPTFALSNNAVIIGFPQTTARLYYLYENGRGIFGDETFSWRFQTRHGEIQLFW